MLAYYASYASGAGEFSIVQQRKWLDGVLDLTLTAQDLHADVEQLSVYLTGWCCAVSYSTR